MAEKPYICAEMAAHNELGKWGEAERQKIRNLAIAANAYVKTVAGDFQVRFDIISIVGSKDKVEAIEHIEDAFNPLLG